VDISQIYRAPSLPRISRRNISSSLIRGAQYSGFSRLRRSSFSFSGLRNQNSTLNSESINSDTILEETNRILIEIQKQLALDFANRITEKKDALESAKIRLSRSRASEKEKKLESGEKSKDDKEWGPFDKVTEKAKNIFERILDFFTIIATGLILNNAFNWISKKENQKKVKQFFDFVAKYWKELLALFIGYKITKFFLGLKKIVDGIKEAIDFFKKKPPGGDCGCGDGKGPKGNGPQDPCSTFRTCIDEISPSTVESLADKIANTTRFNPLFNLLPTARPTTTPPVSTPTTRPTNPLSGDTLFPGGYLSPSESADNSPGSARGTKIVLDSMQWLMLLGGLRRGEKLPQPIIDALEKGNLQVTPHVPRTGIPGSPRISPTVGRPPVHRPTSVPRSKGGTIPGFSAGGSVGGPGSGNVDSVRTMLAPGEEVIRASSAMMFRPLLKDINDNAGKQWIQFSNSIGNMLSYNKTMSSSLDDLNENLMTFKINLDKFVKTSKDQKSTRGGGFTINAPSRESGNTKILPTVVVHSNLKSPTRPVTRTTIPINLPTINKNADFKIPPIDGGMANDDPDISSINPSNEYMFLTPKMYGIFV
jgi:hypothetical protein